MLCRGYRRWLREERRKASIANDFFTRLAEEHRRSRYRPPPPPKPKRQTLADRCAEYDWRKEMITNDGRLGFAPGFANIMIALREHPELSGIVGWDQQVRRVVLKGRLPHDWAPDFEMRFFTRDDLSAIREFLEKEVGLPPPDRNDVYWAVRKVARENPILTEDIHDG